MNYKSIYTFCMLLSSCNKEGVGERRREETSYGWLFFNEKCKSAIVLRCASFWESTRSDHFIRKSLLSFRHHLHHHHLKLYSPIIDKTYYIKKNNNFDLPSEVFIAKVLVTSSIKLYKKNNLS